jgi:hydroxyacyl-ACP dehydratase HTD2-like protein with hotdog domain
MISRHEQRTYDILTPVPTHLLAAALSDFLPASSFPEPFNDATFLSRFSSGSQQGETPQQLLFLPESHHLIHFPLALPPSQLCPDGADPYHSPGAPFERRMWAGGSVVFAKPFPISHQRIVCRERIADVWVRGREGEEKVFVDVERKYDDPEGREKGGLDEPPVVERRILVFMRGLRAGEAAAGIAKGRGGRIIKGIWNCFA